MTDATRGQTVAPATTTDPKTGVKVKARVAGVAAVPTVSTVPTIGQELEDKPAPPPLSEKERESDRREREIPLSTPDRGDRDRDRGGDRGQEPEDKPAPTTAPAPPPTEPEAPTPPDVVPPGLSVTAEAGISRAAAPPKVFSTTSGADKYIVRTPQKGGGYVQSIMSKAQIEALGGTLPKDKERKNILLQVEVKEGRKARLAKEAELVAGDLGISATELTATLSGEATDQLQQFADKYNLSLTATASTIAGWLKDRTDPQFANLNRWAVRDLKRMARHGENPYGRIRIIATQRINEANKLNPRILTTQFLAGGQTNVLNIEEAVKSGLDSETLNIYGQLRVRTLVKWNSADPGVVYERGFGGMTPNMLRELKRERAPSQTFINRMFNEGKKEGRIPPNAIMTGFDAKTQTLSYSLPDTRTGQQVFRALVASGDIAKGSTFTSYDPATGVVEYEPPRPRVLPVGFVGPLAPGEIRAETLFSQLQAEKPELAGTTLISYDQKKGEFSYEEAPAPLTGEIGATLLGGKRISIPVSEEVERALNTVAGFLQIFGGNVDEAGRSLQEQVAYTETIPAVNLISSNLRKSLLRIGNMASVAIYRPEKGIFKDPLGFAVETLYIGSQFIPFIGSAIYTAVEKPPTALIGLSLAIDAAVMFPWLKMGLRSAANIMRKTSNPGKFAVNQIIKQEAALVTATARILRKTVGNQAADAFVSLNKAQTTYATRLATLIELEGGKATSAVRKIDKAIDAATAELKRAAAARNFSKMRQLEKTIRNLKAQRAAVDPLTIAQGRAESAATQLERAADNYKNILKRTGAGMDDGLVAASLDEMPKMIVRNTRTVVKDTISKAITSVKSLRKALGQADSQLIAVQRTSAAQSAKIKSLYDAWQKAGGGMDTAERRAWVQAVEEGRRVDKKLAEVLFRRVEAQKRLELSIARSASELGTKLSQKRTELARLQERLKQAEAIEARGGLTEPPSYKLRSRVKRLQAEVFDLTDRYIKAVKSMELEIRVKFERGRGYFAEPEGLGGRGRGGVAVEAPPELSPTMLQAMRLVGRTAPRVGGGGLAIRAAPRVAPDLTDVDARTMVRRIMVTDAEVREFVSPAEAATMTPSTIRAIEEALQRSIREALKVSTEGKTNTEIRSAIKASIQESIKSATASATKTGLQARSKLMAKTAFKAATRRITARAKLRTGKLKIPVPRIRLRLPGNGAGAEVELPGGTVAYKEGLFWKWIPPEDFRDGVKPRTLPKGVVPVGADTSGGNSPYTTIQRIGTSDAVVPERISIDAGVVDVFITSSGERISYAGGGEQTNVGERIDSPTTGMSVPGISRPDIGTVIPARSVSRTAIAATAKPDRVKQDTTLRGINRPEVVEERRRVVKERIESAEARQVAPEPEDLYPDEDPEWLARFDAPDIDPLFNGNRGINRVKASRKRPRRIGRREEPPMTTLGGMRL